MDTPFIINEAHLKKVLEAKAKLSVVEDKEFNELDVDSNWTHDKNQEQEQED